MKGAAALGATLSVLLVAGPAAAQEMGEALRGLASLMPAGGGEGAPLSGRVVQLTGLVTVLSLAPGILVMTTCFTRFIIVFSMLRSALGLNQTPPNIVLTSLALFLTLFVMQPVFEKSWNDGLEPLLQNRIDEETAVAAMTAPLKTFMFTNTRPAEIALFHGIAEQGATEPAALPQTAEAASWRVLLPAFAISELRRAFLIGFLIYLPFLAIDLIVASILMSAGMMMLPPVLISLPFKVIFFVLIDGWYLLAGSLIESYLGS